MGRYYYPLFMLLGLLVFVLARRCVPRPPALALLPWWQRLSLALAAFVGGVLGAKLPFAMTSPAGWWVPQAWFTDGKTIMTGLAGAYLAVELTKFALEIHVKTGDTFALPLALAMTVGRLGCFFNGCCYRHSHQLALGCFVRATRRCVGVVPSDPTLREPVSLHDGRGAGGTAVVACPARATSQDLSDCLLRLPLPHGIDPTRAGLVGGHDLLPVCGHRAGAGIAVAVGVGTNLGEPGR